MRLDAAIAQSTERLSGVSDSARLDAEMLLCQAINMPRSYLFAHPEDELDPITLDRFTALVERRVSGEPMAYITGIREFWSRELLVSPATLVPRPETELLVSLALQEIPNDTKRRILDLGTGSGAIAISIAGERPLCEVTATDISEDALCIAAENVRQADLANVVCVKGNWTLPVAGLKFDLIVSNPPYVREDDEALRHLSHEPLAALAAGPDGLRDIRTLASACKDLLLPDGWLMLEHGFDQEADVASILGDAGWADIACHTDLAGKPRVTVARHSGT